MGLFIKKSDPVSERARALNAEIAALESQIKKLGNQVDRQSSRPPARSITPSSLPVANTSVTSPVEAQAAAEPIFEEVHQSPLNPVMEPSVTPEHFNEMGVRKYDLPALFRRVQNYFRGQPTNNPQLVNYLAAGSVQGLRPLRYEKRVARNRFIFFTLFLLLMVWGIIAMILHRR